LADPVGVAPQAQNFEGDDDAVSRLGEALEALARRSEALGRWIETAAREMNL
jgi:hypothetical protein